MEEVFPVLAGVVVGLVTSRVMQTWLRVIAVVLLGLAFGAIASWISGELAVSWVYVVIDTAQVIGASVMITVLVRAWRRRLAARMAR
jgi:uncharacterized membrane protein YeaQ/YmgE (transglycosylase-associated protein family)